jgi:hypothetical protein
MSECILATTLFLLVTVAGAQTSTNATTADNPRHVEPSSVVLRGLELPGTVPVIFATLVRELGLSGGVAISNQECSQGPEDSISIPAGTGFDKALGQVAKSGGVSEWRVRDGVANLLPVGLVPPLLQVRIHRFEWDRTSPVREVVDRLRRLPEVSEAVLKLGLKEAPIEGGGGSICIQGDCNERSKSEKALEVDEDATLLTLLNRIVQAHDRAIWNYSEYRCDKNTQFLLGVLAE